MSITLTVTPGKRLVAGELVNNAKLNQLGLPTIVATGLVGPGDTAPADFSSAFAPGAYWYGADTGAANAMAVTLAQPFIAYTDGMVVAVKAGFVNTGATTLALNALSAQPVYKRGNVALTGGELQPGLIVELRYRLDPNLMAGQSYGGGGTTTQAVVAGWSYTWTPGVNDTSITYTDGGGSHTPTTTTTFTPTTASVTLTGTASLTMGGSLITPTSFWEVMTPLAGYVTNDQAMPAWSTMATSGYAFVATPVSHPFGTTAVDVRWSLVCISTDATFAVGDEIDIPASGAPFGSGSPGYSISWVPWKSATQVGLNGSQGSNTWWMQEKLTTYVTTALVAAKWNLRCRITPIQ